MESHGSKHRRNVSSRASRPRAPTKGPLDITDDPLVGSEAAASPQRSYTQSPTSQNNPGKPSSNSLDRFDDLREQLDSILATQKSSPSTKDLSFLLRPEMFHPVTQLDVPPAFRSSFYNPPPGEPLQASLSVLDTMLADGHFLLAAHLCGTLLTSAKLSSTDDRTIFTLFYTRLACLELTGNTAFAAQESKALEDLTSAFYYVDPEVETLGQGTGQNSRNVPHHIVPWPLRVLAVRLQSIGFGDPRRSVAGLYELGLEARREIAQEGIDPDEKKIWRSRLEDLGLRSINALIEMGDLDAARRSLDNLELRNHNTSRVRMNKALLYLRLGDVAAANEIIDQTESLGDGTLRPLISMAEGRYDEAIEGWRSLLELNSDNALTPLISQNLAVCYLYTGRLNEVCYHLSKDLEGNKLGTVLIALQSRDLFESLIDQNENFRSLTFNLSTLYELCSDKSRTLKMRLAEKVANQPHSGETNRDRSNADFKL